MAKEHEVGEFLRRLKDYITNKWGREATAEDIYWVILNQLTKRLIDEPYRVSGVFFQMRDYLILRGKNPKIAISEGQRWLLKGLIEDGIERVVIRTVEDNSVCPECRSLHGTESEISQAINQLLLPSKCTADYCRCSYVDPHELNESSFP
jgi:hypothetical protein